MITPRLFEIAPTALSRQAKLTAFKREQGILTHRAKHFRREDEPWLAILPRTCDKGKSIGEIMADSCRLYEESGCSATGTGELSAVRKLCRQVGIPCNL